MGKNSWIDYLLMECLYCGHHGTMKDFPITQRMKVNKDAPKLLFRCPTCLKRMELCSLYWKKFDKGKVKQNGKKRE